MTAILYGYERSSCTRRVRIALALKGIDYELRIIDLAAGDHRRAEFLAKSPQGQVPALELDGATLCQSVAILEYLEETRPHPPLLPASPLDRARCRQIVEAVNSGIQPLQNTAVLQRLTELSGTRSHEAGWARFWIDRGLAALDATLGRSAGVYSVGDAVSLADVALAPQCFNAGLFELDLAAYPTVARVHAACLALPAFGDVLAA